MIVRIGKPPEWRVVSLEALRQQVQLPPDNTDHDPELIRHLGSVLPAVEGALRLIAQAGEFQLLLDSFPAGRLPIELPKNVVEVSRVEYLVNATTAEIAELPDYYLSGSTPQASRPARLVPAATTYWPATPAVVDTVRVTFTAGWDHPGKIPEILPAMVLAGVERLYNKCGEDGMGPVFQSLLGTQVDTFL